MKTIETHSEAKPGGTALRLMSIFKSIAVIGVAIFATAFIFALLLGSLISTFDMNTNNAMLENVVLSFDNPLMNLIWLIVGGGLCRLILHFTEKVKPIYMTAGLFLLVLVFGIVWVLSVRSAPTHDSYIVTNAAEHAANNDYSPLTEVYFRNFPFQLGYVMFTEIFIRVLCPSEINYVALQIVNVICLAVAYVAILRFSARTMSEKAQRLTAVLLLLCPQPVLFSTFLYGNLPGFMFSMLSLWMLRACLDDKKWYYGLLSAIFIGFAISIKLNNAIMLVAMIIYIIFSLFSNKKALLSKLALLSLTLLLVFGLGKIPKLIYENKAGVKFGDGIPMISWAAMGLHESGIAPGWYNGSYTTANFRSSGFDPDVASESSKAIIKDRLAELKDDPEYTVNFFGKKFYSQFNEPTYQSIWTNQVRDLPAPAERTALSTLVLENNEGEIKAYMNIFQQLIVAAAAVALIFFVKEKNYGLSVLFTILVGGFLYHMLFEAKSQYILTYFILMIPIAAFGIDRLSAVIETKLDKRAKSSKGTNAAIEEERSTV